MIVDADVDVVSGGGIVGHYQGYSQWLVGIGRRTNGWLSIGWR